MNMVKLLRNYFILFKSDFFDSKYYLKENPDVAKAKANPILHYLQFGWKEGRNPSPLFNTSDYISFRPDIVKADICPLVHYELFGKKEFLSFCFNKIKYLENQNKNLDITIKKKITELDTINNKFLFTYNRGINKEKISYEIEKYFELFELGITDKKREHELTRCDSLKN